jgi:radical SAM protein with 4Fe4S-binding SPASM domain
MVGQGLAATLANLRGFENQPRMISFEALAAEAGRTVAEELIRRRIIVGVDDSAGTASQAPATRLFRHLYIEMTSRCNLRCKHCYMEGGLARPSERKLWDWLDVLDQFADLGGRDVTLSGGESLIYHGWGLLADRALERGLSVSMMTNGTYLTAERLDFIASRQIALGFGLDGFTAESHDFNRGKGSFVKVLAGLDLIAAKGYEPLTTICFSPMKFNVYDLPALIDTMVERNLPRLYVSLLEERGRARFFSERLALTEDQRRWLLPYLYDQLRSLLGRLTIEVTHHVEIFERLLSDREPAEPKTLSTIRVTSDGEVYLSAYMGSPEHCAGVIGESSLSGILQSTKTDAIVEMFDDRAERVPACRECVFKGVCRGGVGVLAHSKFGELLVPDEYCPSRIALFNDVVERKARDFGFSAPDESYLAAD